MHGYVMRFVIGQTDNTTAEKRLHEEIRNYGPMLRLDVTESYKNLAWKSHHFFLAVHRYYNADYVVKIDDDVYLRWAANSMIRRLHVILLFPVVILTA